ncbi:hypothetical protein ABMA27_001354 [Loxostege sticticalis]|uniref:FLYWCH-type domain-containing protein n=1 Tax=Loxostege sticticalis TaxID=481309 RepID=A0ABR3HY67_LOXSC
MNFDQERWRPGQGLRVVNCSFLSSVFISLTEGKLLIKSSWIKRSNKGNPIIVIDGYRYSKHTVSGLKTRWYCSHHHKKCSAVLYTIQDEIVSCRGIKPKFIQSQKGNLMLVYKGYRYSKQSVRGLKTRWHCSSQHKRCSAVLFTVDDEIISLRSHHNHPKTD